MSMLNLVVLTPLFEMAIPTLLLGAAFMVDGGASGLARSVGTTDLAGWVGLGVLVASLTVGAIRGVSGTLQSDRNTGVLEHSFASPAPREAFVVGAVGSGTVLTGLASSLLLAFGIGVLGADYDPHGALLCVPVMAVMLVGTCGYGYLTGALSLLVRRPGAVLDPLVMVVTAFSGVAFPLTVLPEVVRWPAFLLPTTWALDLMRYATLDTRPLAPVPVAICALVATSLAFWLLGRWVFRRAVRSVQASGTLTQF